MLEVAIEKQLHTFSLRVQFTAEQESLALLGASGSGKSMTLKCIAGVERPDAGRIVLDGKVLFDSKQHINLPPQQRQIGLLFQNYALFPTMNVMQNIACGCTHLPKAEQKKRVQQFIQEFELMGLERVLPAQLSGGQQQRVALARMLAANPKLLLFDEPFSALDSYLRRQLVQSIGRVIENHTGNSLFISHDFAEAFQLCPQIAVMEQGRITVKKTRNQLFCEPETVGAARLVGYENILSVQHMRDGLQVLGVKISGQHPQSVQAVAISAKAIYPAKPNEIPFSTVLKQILYTPKTVLGVCKTYSDETVLCELIPPFPAVGETLSLSFDAEHLIYLRKGAN